MKTSNLTIVIFPYLFIYEKEGMVIDGLHLRSSYAENVHKENEVVREQLLRIANFFRFGRESKIFQWTYFTANIKSAQQWKNIEKKLNRFVNIIRYIELRDLKEHAKFGQFNYFIFELTALQLEKNKERYFYSGILNGQSTYNFQVQGISVEKSFIPPDEMYPLVIRNQEMINNEYFQALYQFPNRLFGDNEAPKIFRAIDWFNRSYSHYGRGVDLSEGILNAHTAIEALLRPADENREIRAQIKTALNNLLGHSNELNDWFGSFWNLRNSIVHGDVTPESFMYIHPRSKNKKGHRHHLYLARKVFTKCLDSIIKIRSMYPMIGFEDELISNEVRASQAKNLLKKRNITIQKLYTSGAFENISGLRTDDDSEDKKGARILGNLFLPFLKQDLEKNEKEEARKEIIEKIDQILNWKGTDLGDLAMIYADLESSFSDMYFKSSSEKIEFLALRGAAYNLFGFMTWRLLTFFPGSN